MSESGVQVYVFCLHDGDAQTWLSEVAVVAPSRSEAITTLRARGVRLKEIKRSVVTVWSVGEHDWLVDTTVVWRRLLDDAGWTPWSPVPTNWP